MNIAHFRKQLEGYIASPECQARITFRANFVVKNLPLTFGFTMLAVRGSMQTVATKFAGKIKTEKISGEDIFFLSRSLF